MPEKELEKQLKAIRHSEASAFLAGQRDMLNKVLELVKYWENGFYSDEEFKKILKDISKEFYGK